MMMKINGVMENEGDKWRLANDEKSQNPRVERRAAHLEQPQVTSDAVTSDHKQVVTGDE